MTLSVTDVVSFESDWLAVTSAATVVDLDWVDVTPSLSVSVVVAATSD